MLIWDYDKGMEIDDERGLNGFNRPDVSDAWIMAHALNEQQSTEEALRRDLAKMTRERNLAADHAEALKRVALDVVTSLGEGARQYSIEQDLCGQYERFLSIACGEMHETHARSAADAEQEMWNLTRGSDEHAAARSEWIVNKHGQDLIERMVRFSTRAREYIVTAPVTVTTRTVGRNSSSALSDPYGYGIESAVESMINSGNVSVSNVDASNVVTSEGEPLNYDAAQRANENYHRRGTYSNN